MSHVETGSGHDRQDRTEANLIAPVEVLAKKPKEQEDAYDTNSI